MRGQRVFDPPDATRKSPAIRRTVVLLAVARSASVAGALSVAGPVLAGSDSPDVANGTGDDPTQPLGKIELLDRYTEAPGPGVEEGTTKTIQTNTPFARIERRRLGSRRNGS